MRFLTIILFIFIALSSCFKNNPTKETWKASGAWSVEEIKIDYYSNKSVDSTKEIKDAGFLMLVYVDDFMYENPFSYSLDGINLSSSNIYSFFKICDVWGISTGKKVFNLGLKDASTGYISFICSFTVNQLTNQKFELQYVSINPITSEIEMVEIWKMKRKTH